jgi:hypothetical protein
LRPLEQRLNEWEELCRSITTSATASLSQHSPGSKSAEDAEGSASIFAILHQMAEMMAQSQRAQALQGQATTLLARQVISCIRDNETQLHKTVKVREFWCLCVQCSSCLDLSKEHWNAQQLVMIAHVCN